MYNTLFLLSATSVNVSIYKVYPHSDPSHCQDVESQEELQREIAVLWRACELRNEDRQKQQCVKFFTFACMHDQQIFSLLFSVSGS